MKKVLCMLVSLVIAATMVNAKDIRTALANINGMLPMVNDKGDVFKKMTYDNGVLTADFMIKGVLGQMSQGEMSTHVGTAVGNVLGMVMMSGFGPEDFVYDLKMNLTDDSGFYNGHTYTNAEIKPFFSEWYNAVQAKGLNGRAILEEMRKQALQGPDVVSCEIEGDNRLVTVYEVSKEDKAVFEGIKNNPSLKEALRQELLRNMREFMATDLLKKGDPLYIKCVYTSGGETLVEVEISTDDF